MKAVPKIQIDRTSFNRGKQDIQSWLSSWLGAESKSNPKRQRLIDLYEWLMVDGHLKAVSKNRKSKLKGEDFGFYHKETGEENLELKKFFHKKRWFTQWRNHAQDSRLFGFSLIEVYEQKKDSFEVKTIKLVERRNVLVERQEVLVKPSDNVGVPIVGNEYEPYYLLVDGDEGLGLLLNIAPLIIYKRFSASSWSVFLEKYGMPIMSLSTDRTAEEKASVNNDLQQLGREGTIGLGLNEILNVHFPAGLGDSYKNYKEMVAWCNEEISKLIVGQTMTIDNGSSRAQGEVHERTLEEIQEEDMEWLEAIINDDLIPRLVSIGYPSELLNYTFEHCKLRNKRLLELAEQEKKTEEVKDKLFEKITSLLNTGNYIVEPKFIEENFGIPVILVEQKAGSLPANQKKKPLHSQ